MLSVDLSQAVSIICSAAAFAPQNALGFAHRLPSTAEKLKQKAYD
jgi:hypothetical protein